jgi:hypothetical protein
MTKSKRRGASDSAPTAPSFEPVKLRYRHDGLTPARQVALVQALAECGCVRAACARVGISAESFYKLLKRPDAQSLRMAVELALDGAADRIEDGAFSRALHGTLIPHYYKGELVGEHRRYDERLTMFILRYRKPSRYGKHLDRRGDPPHPERSALGLADMLAWVEADARRDEVGVRRQVITELADDGMGGEEDGPAWNKANLFRWGPAAGAPAKDEPEDVLAGPDFDDDDDDDRDDPDPIYGPALQDVASGSSTSGKSPNRRARRRATAKVRKR